MSKIEVAGDSATDHHESGKSEPFSKWIEDMRGSLMVVATVITTITYQPSLSPPGGVWQTDIKNPTESNACPNPPCEAGTLVLAYGSYELVFLFYLICNTMAFTASLSVMFLLISGFSLKNKCFMVVLTLAMCTTLTFLGITYVLAFILLIPPNLRSQLGLTMYIPIGVLVCLILLVLLIHSIRFLYWLVCKIFKCAKK